MTYTIGHMNRRNILKAGGTALIASPFVWNRPAFAAGEVIIRSSGGAPEENSRKNIWGPFEKETGIRVVPVAATAAKLFAMFKSGNVELDVIDVGAGPLINLERLGALASIDYQSWKRTDPNDIKTDYRSSHRVGHTLFATVLGFNKISFSSGAIPASWQDFWDTKRFPGPRSLADLATGNPSLEAALLADGVARDKIYPIDLDRAFTSLSRIRPSIPKFWDTGALSVQMLIDREVNMNAIWSTRISPAIAAGQPLGFTWNDHLTIIQAYAIFKNAKNFENAQRYIDFALQPHIQAAVVQASMSGVVNGKGSALLPPGFADQVPGSSKQQETGFLLNDIWWEDNRDAVNRRWARWIQS